MKFRFNAKTGLAVVTAMLAIGVSGEVLAKTYYVEKWGTSNPDCSKSDPCVGIGDALAVAIGKNDKIVIGPGHYKPMGVMTLGVEGLKLESTAGRHATIIEGGPASHVMEITNSKVQVGKKGKGFTILGAIDLLQAAIYINVTADGPTNIKIQGNRIGVARAVDDTESDTGEFSNYRGIYVNEGGEKIQVRDNIIENNQTFGVQCLNECERALISDNTISSNGSGGMQLDDAAMASIRNNLLVSNYGAGINIPDTQSVSVQVRDNVVYGTDDETGLQVFNSDGALVQGNISTENYVGFHLEQSSYDGKSLKVQNNLGVSSGEEGFLFIDTESAIVSNNTTADTFLDGFEFESISALSSLKNINSFNDGNCGLLSTSSDPLPVSKFFANPGDSTGLLCDPGDFPLVGSQPNKPAKVNVSRARKL